jgi:dsRNA-specific ribonuclease
MKLYGQAFTSPSVDQMNNYESLEILGDATANKAIVWYFSKRFPQLNCAKGVKILSRLKINYVSKSSFSSIAERLGFWKFITVSVNLRERMRKKLLTDVLEALIAAVEENINQRIRNGIGYAICYNIIESLFNDIPISLKYEDLFDAKTRLKETIDFFPNELKRNAKIETKVTKVNDIHYVEIILAKNRESFLLGKGESKAVKVAEQFAAKQALYSLVKIGYKKEIPEGYKEFCEIESKVQK